jgi:predicted acyltransferase (DUF342 family)
MRKKKDKDKKPNLRSILYTSKYFNTGKGNEIKKLLENMSEFSEKLLVSPHFLFGCLNFL